MFQGDRVGVEEVMARSNSELIHLLFAIGAIVSLLLVLLVGVAKALGFGAEDPRSCSCETLEEK